MAYTLISMIGAGMYKPEANSGGYEETDYCFDNTRHFKTRLFIQAVLEYKAKSINQVILLGTDTSSWDCLVDKDNDDRDEVIELWDSLVDQCEQKQKGEQPSGVSRENLDRLEKYLSERFAVDVIIRMHRHDIDDSTSEELFNVYSGVTKLVKHNNDILFDITHGFRSMPVLLYQSLQYSLSLSGSRKVEIIYGERKGCARNLSSYWKYSELSSALNVFSSKLDGFRLAELVKKDWEKGSKAIQTFSEIVQTNFALQIFDVARQIRNALEAYPKDAPAWLGKVKAELEPLVSIIDEADKPRSLFRYSEYLYGHHLNVQAVITLQIAVEAAIVLKYWNEEKLGDYPFWQYEGGDRKLDELKHENWSELGIYLSNLENFRNQIAHGGGKDSKTNVFPSVANISGIYENGKKGVEQLLALLADI